MKPTMMKKIKSILLVIVPKYEKSLLAAIKGGFEKTWYNT